MCSINKFKKVQYFNKPQTGGTLGFSVYKVGKWPLGCAPNNTQLCKWRTSHILFTLSKKDLYFGFGNLQ
jgi:hypothetical protein